MNGPTEWQEDRDEKTIAEKYCNENGLNYKWDSGYGMIYIKFAKKTFGYRFKDGYWTTNWQKWYSATDWHHFVTYLPKRQPTQSPVRRKPQPIK